MDNYNLRENFNEQLKMIEDYKSLVTELYGIVDTMNEKPTKENAQRCRELVQQLRDMI